MFYLRKKWKSRKKSNKMNVWATENFGKMLLKIKSRVKRKPANDGIVREPGAQGGLVTYKDNRRNEY